jgi:sugar/nucleoside kinase (ribokinase family)
MSAFFVSPPTVDATCAPIPGQPLDSPKLTCEIDLWIGGGGPNALRAFAALADVPAEMISVVGENDVLSQVTVLLLEAEFGDTMQPVAAAPAGRFSAITPDPAKPGACRAHTNRPQINSGKLTAAIKAAFARKQPKRLFLSGISDTAALTHIIRLAHRFGVAVYLLPTSDQLRRQAEFLALLRHLEPGDWVQQNRQELETLTPVAGVVEGVQWLREQGCSASLLVTDGANGAYAWSAIEGNWFHANAFDVPLVNDLTAGDTLAGSFLAWIETPEGADLERGLWLASAAAARQVARMPRACSWSELEAWACETPEKTICEPEVSWRDRIEPALLRLTPSRDFVRGALATAAAFATLMLTLAYAGAA